LVGLTSLHISTDTCPMPAIFPAVARAAGMVSAVGNTCTEQLIKCRLSPPSTSVVEGLSISVGRQASSPDTLHFYLCAETKLQGLLGSHLLASQAQFHCAALANLPHQPLRPTSCDRFKGRSKGKRRQEGERGDEEYWHGSSQGRAV